MSVLLITSSISFWYYWPRGRLPPGTSLFITLAVSIVSVGGIYIADRLLLKLPSFSRLPLRIVPYLLLVTGFIGSTGVIWIPASVYLVLRFWNLLAVLPLYVSAVGGSILFMAGIILFLMVNR